ncbi:MAG TPA: 2OG-Fe(II) oxygenase [Trebonia sp.]|nr:2OG-Fe(II) oxygenase [Trebonia sp.]
MTTAARDRLAELLGGSGQAAASSLELRARAADIQVAVEGAGPLAYPVPAAQARELIGLGTAARFGRGEQTLTDLAVRDTWEIPRSLVTAQWDETALAAALAGVRDGLGLPPGCELEISLHSMLVYDKGQFFVTHQDSEKDDAMIGTLVVTLPSAFTGGDLLIGEGEEWKAYRGSTTGHVLVAFYADRQHEVLPVKSGYRVTLTYNLLLRGGTSGQAPADAAAVASLAQCLGEHFSVTAERWGRSLGHPPARLVYLLDHEYTPRGLSWARLKGADATRAALLRAAAGQADCEVMLALAEVRETHEAYPAEDYDEYGHYDAGEDDDESDDDDGPDDGDAEYEVHDLIDSGAELTRWLTPDGTRAEDITLPVGDHETCASTPTGHLKPYSSQYEGNMGNYGNTLDRWYKRGAIVVCPREQAFASRAETSPRWAMEELSARARSGDVAGARTAARTLDRFWEQAAGAQATVPGLFPATLRAAADLRDAAVAEALLRPFRVERLQPSDAAALAELAAYGPQWTGALLAGWYGDGRRTWSQPEAREKWLTALPALCAALQAAGAGGTAIARQILRLGWTWLRARAAGWLPHRARGQREKALAALGAPLAAILAAAELAGLPELVEEITDFTVQQPHEVLPLLLATLRAPAAPPPAAAPDGAQRDAGFAGIAASCAARLRVLQGGPRRDSDDWSVRLPSGGCTCEVCGTLTAFLADRARRTLEWPLRKEDRQHVHTRIDAAELPVTHVTRRTGRPFTLVLTKTERLFTAEHEDRAAKAGTLEWLAATWLARLPTPAASQPHAR